MNTFRILMIHLYIIFTWRNKRRDYEKGRFLGILLVKSVRDKWRCNILIRSLRDNLQSGRLKKRLVFIQCAHKFRGFEKIICHNECEVFKLTRISRVNFTSGFRNLSNGWPIILYVSCSPMCFSPHGAVPALTGDTYGPCRKRTRKKRREREREKRRRRTDENARSSSTREHDRFIHDRFLYAIRACRWS